MSADKELIRQRFEANFRRYHRLASVQKDICAELADMASEFCDPCDIKSALEVGAGTGFLSAHLIDMFPEAKWYFNDISDASSGYLAEYVLENTSFLWGDAENIDFPKGLDLIASASTAQWFDDFPCFVTRAADATNSGGWILLSTFGPDNFREIRETTGDGLDYYTLDELRAIVEQADYKIIASSEYIRTLYFSSPLEVLRHIKATGVNSLNRKRWGKARLASFEAHYRKSFGNEYGVSLTYHPQLIIAQKI